MYIRNLSKLAILSAAIVSTSALVAETVDTNRTTDPSMQTATPPATVTPSRANERSTVNSQDLRKGSAQEDHIGVVTFEENSSELDTTAEQTLSSIARDLDKNKPTELVVEVSGAGQSASQDNMDSGTEMQGQRDTARRDESTAARPDPRSPSAGMDSQSQQLTEVRAKQIKEFLTEQGIQVRDVEVEGVQEGIASLDSADTQAGMNSESEADRGRASAAREGDKNVQKLRIVITEKSTPGGLSAR